MQRSVTGLGELSLLFWAALRGAVRRPFYWKEFFDQCRFILTANFIPLLLTGVGWGVIVSLEAGHFFASASSEWRFGGLARVGHVRGIFSGGPPPRVAPRSGAADARA